MLEDLLIFTGESTNNMQDAADQARAAFLAWLGGGGEGQELEISPMMQFGPVVDSTGMPSTRFIYTITVTVINAAE